MFRRSAPVAVLAAAVLAAASPAQQLDAPPNTAYPDDLAVGPFEAVLTPVFNPSAPAEKNDRRKVVVRFVTKGKVAVTENGRLQLYNAEQVATLAALKANGKEDEKRVWQYDPKAKALAGPVVLPPPIDASPSPTTPDQLAVYLLLRAERLHRTLDRVIDRRDAAAAADVVGFADRLRGTAVGAKLPPPVAELYRLDGYAKEQLGHLARQEDALIALRSIKLTAEQKIAAAAQEGIAAGGARFLLGGDGRDVLDELRLAKARQDDIAQQAKALEGPQRAAFVRAVADRADGRAALARRLDAAAAALRVDPGALTRLDDLAKQYAASKDDAAAAALLSARADRAAAAAGGRRFPLLVCEVLRLKARGLDAGADDRAGRAEKLIALARAAEEAARDVPPGAIFDGDRVEVLTAAAEFAHRAVTAGNGPQVWSLCYDTRAEYGVRLADAALQFGVPLDPGGDARAVRAWLLFQRGKYQEAADGGKGVAGVRERDPVTQYNLARVFGKLLSGKLPVDCAPAAGYLEKAIDAGFYDIKMAKSDPDLIAARNTPQWAPLITPNVEAVMEATPGKSPGQSRFNLWLHNKSRFALKDVNVTYKGSVQSQPGAKGWQGFTRTPKIAYLPPGESYLMTDIPDGLDIKLAPRVALKSVYLNQDLPLELEVKRGQVEYVPYWLRVNPYRWWGYYRYY